MPKKENGKETKKEQKPKAEKQKLKRIAVLCSGGDSPGMNCAVRAVVRTAIGNDLEVYGIRKGYTGLLEGNFTKMDASSVGNILQHGRDEK